MTGGQYLLTGCQVKKEGESDRQQRPPFKPLSFLPVGVVVKNPQRKRRKMRATMTTMEFFGQFHSFVGFQRQLTTIRDYHAELILIATHIDQMKQRWPLLPPSIDHGHSFTINNNADLNSNTSPSPALSAMTNHLTTSQNSSVAF